MGVNLSYLPHRSHVRPFGYRRRKMSAKQVASSGNCFSNALCVYFSTLTRTCLRAGLLFTLTLYALDLF